ncbi:hypothetical protein C5S32_06330 [ANME-1 cluster archaeon GoMg1]|nr:hypothetical protein [ANME-1 cluster archaeon GoMg1]
MGVNTPEIREEGYEKAKEFVNKTCWGEEVKLDVYDREQYDPHYRILAVKIEKFIYPFTFRIFKGEKMLFEILAFIIGLIYGYVKPGKEKRWELFKKGIMYGIILGIIFGFIGLFIGGLIYSAATAIGMFITVIILVVMFLIGTFIGDILEVAIKK